MKLSEKELSGIAGAGTGDGVTEEAGAWAHIGTVDSCEGVVCKTESLVAINGELNVLLVDASINFLWAKFLGFPMLLRYKLFALLEQ